MAATLLRKLNRSPTTRELKRENYSDNVIFSINDTCLTRQWASEDELVISCSYGSISAGSIAVQKQHSGKIKISYVDIPVMKQELSPMVRIERDGFLLTEVFAIRR